MGTFKKSFLGPCCISLSTLANVIVINESIIINLSSAGESSCHIIFIAIGAWFPCVLFSFGLILTLPLRACSRASSSELTATLSSLHKCLKLFETNDNSKKHTSLMFTKLSVAAQAGDSEG